MRWMPLIVLLAACTDTGPNNQDSGADLTGSVGDTAADSAAPGDSGPIGETGDTAGPSDTGDAPEPKVWYYDGDGDGYGNADYTVESVQQPDGYVDNAYDCDDANADVYPHAPELCDGLDNDCDGTEDEEAPTWYADEDSDGYGDASQSIQACEADGYVTNAEDCDDSDESAFPGAAEFCDGVDNDCNGDVDDDARDAEPWFHDVDGDGTGDPSDTVMACEPPDSSWVDNDDDCDDLDASIYEGAPEFCDDLDHDCDGASDDADPGETRPWYLDADGDGYGDIGETLEGCEAPAGYVSNDLDCDDADRSVNPTAEEVCDGLDNDCDGDADSDATDRVVFYADADGDRYGDAGDKERACEQPAGFVTNSEDCDDRDDDIHPDAHEVCDNEDNDCNGLIDDDDSGVMDPEVFYADSDGDGFGAAAESVDACVQPAGYVEDDSDCDDDAAAVNPDATEICDAIDNDCDARIDDADSSVTGQSTFYEDADGDGFEGTAVVQCFQEDLAKTATDCDDGDGAVNPDATEICDGIDNDCQNGADDADPNVEGQTYYFEDLDGDGQGNGSEGDYLCSAPSWPHSTSGTDCDDSDAAIYLGAYERCDGIDNDCDGAIDSSDSDVLDEPTWYRDWDDDLYGAPDNTKVQCDEPAGYVADGTDCDDTDGDVNPAAQEVCDGVDNDCDSDVDDDDSKVYSGQTTWYKDSDRDGYGDIDRTQSTCDAPSGYVAKNTDCDDGEASTYPGATEYCDQVDNDCDGDEDELDDVVDTIRWYVDGDEDGYGSTAYLERCDYDDPSGSKEYVTNNDDCYDGNDDVHPGSTTTSKSPYDGKYYDYDCNGVDEPLYDTIHQCSSNNGSVNVEGWAQNSVPDCGVKADWAPEGARCKSGLPDSRDLTTNTQRCN